MIPSPQNGCSPGSYRLNTAVTPFLKNLSRRLEYLLLFELTKNVVFLYQPVREPLRSDNVIIDPIWIEALNSWVLAQLPILMLAGLASAESAVQLGLLLKANCLDRWFLKSVNTTFNSHTLDMSTLSKWGDCFENSIFLLIVRGDMFLQRYRVMLSIITGHESITDCLL